MPRQVERSAIPEKQLEDLLTGDFDAAFLRSQQRNSRETTPSEAPPGEELYARHCAVCHGSDLKGTGLVPAPYRTPPDLTTLSRRHGKFPMRYVSDLLRNGPLLPAHALAEMPVWGSEFAERKDANHAQVAARIRNLSAYIKSRQQKCQRSRPIRENGAMSPSPATFAEMTKRGCRALGECLSFMPRMISSARRSRAALRSVPTGFTLIRYETKPAPGNQYGASRGIVTEITSEDEGKAASLMTHGQMGRAQ